MKVWINRNVCGDNLATCESCFGQFVRTGQPDRYCIMRTEEDGQETLTVVLHTEDKTVTLVIPPEKREEVAYEGWTKYVPFEPPFRKNEGTGP